PFPVTGAAVTATVAGLVLTSPFLFSGGRRRIVLTRRSFFLFCLAGFSATAAYLFMFRALGGGEVSLVSPLISVFPLFSVFLSYLFLGPEEKVTWRVVSGGCLVVAGASSVLLS
ncbi:MAG: EamA family transporter, partial [Nitrospinota bacterium]